MVINNTNVEENEKKIIGLYGLVNSDYKDNCYNKCLDCISICLDIEEMYILSNILNKDIKIINLIKDYQDDDSLHIFNYNCELRPSLFEISNDKVFDIESGFVLKVDNYAFSEDDFWQVLIVSYMINAQNIIDARNSLGRICIYCDCGYILLKRYVITQIIRCIDFYVNSDISSLDLCATNINGFLYNLKQLIVDIKENNIYFDILDRYVISFVDAFDWENHNKLRTQLEDNKLCGEIYWSRKISNTGLSYVFEGSGNPYDEIEFYELCLVFLKIFKIFKYNKTKCLNELISYSDILNDEDTEDINYKRLFEKCDKVINYNYEREIIIAFLQKVKDYLSDYDDLSTEKLDELCQYIDDAPYNNC